MWKLYVTMLSCGALFCADPRVFSEKDGVVAMEAEHATSISGWVADAAYPGSGVTMRDDAARGEGKLVYRIAFSHPGTYVVWFRHRKPDGATDKANDCTVTFAGKPLRALDSGNAVFGMGTHQTALAFQSRAKTENAADRSSRVGFDVGAAGVYEFVVVSRSRGYLLDKIVLIHEQAGGRDPAPKAIGPLTGFGPDETVPVTRIRRR